MDTMIEDLTEETYAAALERPGITAIDEPVAAESGVIDADQLVEALDRIAATHGTALSSREMA